MTGTSAKNSYGIFKTKRARDLATKYNLHLTNSSAYIHSGKFITFSDVKFIVDNLWLNHFMYDQRPPISINDTDYNDMFYYLEKKYPQLLNYSSL